MSMPVKVGIAVGVSVGVLLAILIGILAWRACRKKPEEDHEESNVGADQSKHPCGSVSSPTATNAGENNQACKEGESPERTQDSEATTSPTIRFENAAHPGSFGPLGQNPTSRYAFGSEPATEPLATGSMPTQPGNNNPAVVVPGSAPVSNIQGEHGNGTANRGHDTPQSGTSELPRELKPSHRENATDYFGQPGAVSVVKAGTT